MEPAGRVPLASLARGGTALASAGVRRTLRSGTSADSSFPRPLPPDPMKPLSLLATCLLPATALAGGPFAPPQNVPAGLSPAGVAAGDITGDGVPDIAVATDAPDKVEVLSGAGGGQLTPFSTVLLGAGTAPNALACADFTGDGLLDLAVTLKNVNRLQVLVNGGAFVLSPGGFATTGADPRYLAVGDVDGDGDLDLLAATSSGGLNMLSVFLNAGGGAFGPAMHFPTGGTNPDSVVARDFDGDGAIDAAVTNQDSNQLSFFPGLGGGMLFGPPVLEFTGTTPGELVASDVGGDGSLDLVVSSRDSNSLSLFCGTVQGTTNYCVGAPNSVGPGGVIGSSRSLSVVANTFGLTADGVVPAQAGLFDYGSLETQVPFGDGFRCVGGTIFRLNPAQVAGPAGSVAQAVDFTTAPAGTGPGAITPGSTWKFQYWYRDSSTTGTGGTGFNLTDALSVTFQP